MSSFVFEHYIGVSQIAIAVALPLTLVTALVAGKGGRLKAVAVAFTAYLAIVALGMSSDIKHLSLIGAAHAAIAFVIAGATARHLGLRAAWPLLVPCLFIAVVMIFNVAHDGMGLELMGRWNQSG
ncbi:MAG: hypothetical protein ACNS61_06610 [Candidatus Wenzhouxiangella sp. M2_3B_020]